MLCTNGQFYSKLRMIGRILLARAAEPQLFPSEPGVSQEKRRERGEKGAMKHDNDVESKTPSSMKETLRLFSVVAHYVVVARDVVTCQPNSCDWLCRPHTPRPRNKKKLVEGLMRRSRSGDCQTINTVSSSISTRAILGRVHCTAIADPPHQNTISRGPFQHKHCLAHH